jgi:hypothetical protein
MSASFFSGEVRYTKRYQLGQLLGGCGRHFLLMTATPHNGKEEDFQLFMRFWMQTASKVASATACTKRTCPTSYAGSPRRNSSNSTASRSFPSAVLTLKALLPDPARAMSTKTVPGRAAPGVVRELVATADNVLFARRVLGYQPRLPCGTELRHLQSNKGLCHGTGMRG